MFSFKNNSKVKEIVFWSCNAAILAGIAYLIFIPEDDNKIVCNCNDDDFDDFDDLDDDEI